MDKIMDEWIDYMKEEKKLTKNSLEAYVRDILQLNQYLLEDDKLDYRDTSKTTIITYLASLQRKGRASSTISRHLASIRCFFQYLLNNKYIDEDPTLNLKSPRPEKRAPAILTESEVEILLAQPQADNFKGARDKAMLELLYATGLRVSQIISIETGDIDLEMGILEIREEDNTRFIPVGNIAIEALGVYMEEYRSAYREKEDGPLFVNYRGNGLSRQGFWKIIKSYTEETGIDKKITPNTLRHSFAVHLIENGANIETVQEMLGHSELATTQVYSFANDNKKLREVYKKSHPRA